METYPNGMMRIDRENGGYDYSAVDAVVDAIVRDLSPKMIILFGSVARGTADGDSDMDLMVVMDTAEKHTRRSSDVQMALWRRKIVLDADIIVVTPEEYEENKGNEHSFIHEIVSTGKVVFEAGGRRFRRKTIKPVI